MNSITPTPTSDRQIQAIATWLRVFLTPGQVAEVRALNVGSARARSFISGDVDELARQAAAWDGEGAKGVYFTPKPLRPDLAGNRAAARKADVIARHWLLIDVDPARPDDCSSSDEERRAAWAVLDRCRSTMDGAGFVGAVVGDSGNGWHLCYPIDLPNDDNAQELVKAVLTGLAKRCNDERAQVDVKTHDAPRIWKLYGTRARKGEETGERPHRWTQLVEGQPWAETASQANAARISRLLDLWRYAEDTRKGRPQTNEQSYAAAALKQEVAAVQAAKPGERNHQLNKSAFALGQLVGAGLLMRQEVEQALHQAAHQIGLANPETQATIRSGLNSGVAEPRDLSTLNGHSKTGKPASSRTQPVVSAETSSDPLDQDATAADLIEQGIRIRWAWEKWLPPGVLTVLASEPGIGKTRFCADLARRIYLRLPWPDGSLPTFPQGSRTLWVPADNQHAELGSIPQAFGFPPDCLFLNATKRNPFAGTLLDDPEDLKDFEARIRRVQPAVVFVDTSLNATDKSAHKPEDAKAFFVPLQQIAARQGVVMVCVTHLNASGTPLGRRIMGQARVVMQLERPDPEGQPNRRKLHVVKSNSLYPPPLGVTMGDQGNEYDLQPPEAAAAEEPGRKRQTERFKQACAWLTEKLKAGPVRVFDLRRMSEQDQYSPKTLYAARDALPVEQFEAEGKKWWRLTENVEAE